MEVLVFFRYVFLFYFSQSGDSRALRERFLAPPHPSSSSRLKRTSRFLTPDAAVGTGIVMESHLRAQVTIEQSSPNLTSAFPNPRSHMSPFRERETGQDNVDRGFTSSWAHR